MQIFVISPTPEDTIKILDDTRVRKMSIEQAQLICSRLPGSPYKPYNPNCGLAKWVHESQENYNWSVQYLYHLILENHHRFGKSVGRTEEVFDFAVNFMNDESKSPEKFYNESYFKESACIFSAYRDTLVAKWKETKTKLKWTNRSIPEFAKDIIGE